MNSVVMIDLRYSMEAKEHFKVKYYKNNGGIFFVHRAKQMARIIQSY